MNTPRNIQSPYTSTDFWNNFSSVNPRMAVFMKVTPALSTSLTTIGLTSNTRDMTLAGHSGVTFKSAAGLMPSSFEQAMGDPTALEMTGIFDSVLFDRDDVLGGLWENASVEIFVRSWDSTAINYGELLIFKGFLGEFRDYQLYFKAEGRGLLSKLSQNAVWVTSRACRVKKFRDSQCGHTSDTVTINSVTYSISGLFIAIDGSSSRRELIAGESSFIPNNPAHPVPPTDFFNNGIITCISGANQGLSREVLKYQFDDPTNSINLSFKRAFPFALAFDDEFSITAGCNRTVEDCRKYGNIINYRGEPYVPGLTTVSKVPGSDES